jgi:Fe-S cluster biogenesis protein NfuA
VTINRADVDHALDDVRPLVAGDGGVLSIVYIDEVSGIVKLQLDLGEVTCGQCVVEPRMLREIIEEYFQGHVGGVKNVAIDDPRLSGHHA